jgi:2-oxoisovalerate dehydrogenase E1 component alpha subunit
MRTAVCDGNDPEACWFAIAEAMEYVRTERKPFVLEARLSRLYGHSSSSGSNYVEDEVDCLVELEKKLDARGWRSLDESKRMREEIQAKMQGWYKQVLDEPHPDPEDIWDYVFADRNYVAEGV